MKQLDSLRKKIFGVKEEMAIAKEGNEGEAVIKLAEFDIKFKEIESQLSVKLEELTAALSKVEQLQTALAVSEQGKEEAITALKNNTTAARRSLLSKEIGDERAAEILAATETLSDEAFGKVASAMVNASTAEAKTALFKEVGVEGKVEDVSKVAQEESGEMKRLKAKYNPAK